MAKTSWVQEDNTNPTLKLARGRGRSKHHWMHLPAIFYLVLLTQIPFLYAIWLSLHSWNLLEPALGKPFVGLSNFTYELVKDPQFWVVVGNTAKLVLGSMVLAMFFGTVLAFLLNRPFRGRNLLRLLAIVPFLITPSVAAVIWKNLILNNTFGILDWLLSVVGLPRVAWLSQFPMLTIIVISAWEWTPFFMLVVIAGLQSVPQESIEAAQVDGASGLRILVQIVLPYLKNYYEVALLLGTIFIFQTFGKVYIATGGGPGVDTTTLPYYTYQVAFQHWQVGQAAALGVFGVVLAIIFAKFMVRFFQGKTQGVNGL